MRTARWPIAAVLAVVAVALAVVFLTRGVDADRPPGLRVGFNNNAVTQNLATPAQAAELLARVGADVDRVQIDWAAIEPRPGEYDFGVYDEIYREDLARGIEPLFIFAFAPEWANGGVCAADQPDCHAPPTAEHYDDAARTAAAIANRYPRAAGIEIWNEPNVPFFWTPRADPAAYAELLTASYEAIKAVDPSMPVAGGSMSSSPAFDERYVQAPDFLRGIYENGAGDSLDAVSVHPYPEPGDVSGESAVESLEAVREVRDSAGDPATPVWVTETGISTTGPDAVPDDAQAVALEALDSRLAEAAGVEMLLVHTLVESTAAPDSPEPGFGVLRPDHSPKPAYCLLAEVWDGDAC